MKAAQSRGSGISLVEVTTPTPGTGEVLIRVLASAINPVDLVFANGSAHRAGWFGANAPVATGWDVAGIVEAIGEGVSGFNVGDQVAGLDDKMQAQARGHSDFVVLEASSLARVPTGLTLEQAGAMTLNALTADQALDLIGPANGRELLITGAAGSVGGHAVAEAVRRGFRTFGLARASDIRFLEDLGAVPIQSLEGRRFDAAIDSAVINPIRHIRDGGAIVGLYGMSPLVPERGIQVHQMLVHPDGARLGELLNDASAGQQPVTVLGTFTRSRIAEAFSTAEKPGQRGRWVVVPD